MRDLHERFGSFHVLKLSVKIDRGIRIFWWNAGALASCAVRAGYAGTPTPRRHFPALALKKWMADGGVSGRGNRKRGTRQKGGNTRTGKQRNGFIYDVTDEQAMITAMITAMTRLRVP